MALLGEEAIGRADEPFEPSSGAGDAATAAAGGSDTLTASVVAAPGELTVDDDLTIDSGAFDSVAFDSGAIDSDEAIDSGRDSALGQRVKRSNPLIEVGCLVFVIWVYSWLQDLAPLRNRLARVNGERLLSFEHSIGIHPELALDRWLTHHSVLAFIFSNFYDNAIFAITFGFAGVIWWRRPDLFRALRNDLVLANLIAFVVFWAFPVAPPRMFPRLGFTDVVATAGGLGAWHNQLVTHADQLAAMPSMHMGYAVWCSIVAWRMARTQGARVAAALFGLGYPLLTALVVMATANHYLVDVVAGVATTFLAVVFVETLAPVVIARARQGWAERYGDRGSGPYRYQRSSM